MIHLQRNYRSLGLSDICLTFFLNLSHVRATFLVILVLLDAICAIDFPSQRPDEAPAHLNDKCAWSA
jgi:hypothetical protein